MFDFKDATTHEMVALPMKFKINPSKFAKQPVL
jgi:hypothetical protein